MDERWIVRSNVGGILHLPKNRLTFKHYGDQKDLVRLLDKTVHQLERDEELKLHFAYNNLVTIEKKSTEDIQNSEIAQKLDNVIDIVRRKERDGIESSGVSRMVDQIIEMMGSSRIDVQSKMPQVNLDIDDILIKSGLLEELKRHIDKIVGSKPDKMEVLDEDVMRDEAMKKLLAESKVPEKSFETLGKDKEIEGTEGHEHLIDF